ncbi:MAG: biotin--[acetyl-CoA-carboxylase] ligase [Planctomycetota bacterium]
MVETTWVDQAHYLHDVGSTNDAALSRASHSSENTTELFVTDHQPSGRGRGANTWWSPPGALAFSLLTRGMAIPVDRLAQASLAVGVAICEAIEEFLPVEVQLKWPNDVFIEGRKACGVLIESPGSGHRRLVIGVGINVNNSVRDAPEELRETAIGMVDAVSRSPHEGPAPVEFDRTAVLAACVRLIGERLAMLENDDRRLPQLWRTRSLLTGRQVKIRLPTRDVAGVVESIADDGALVVSTQGGVERCYGGVVAEW